MKKKHCILISAPCPKDQESRNSPENLAWRTFYEKSNGELELKGESCELAEGCWLIDRAADIVSAGHLLHFADVQRVACSVKFISAAVEL